MTFQTFSYLLFLCCVTAITLLLKTVRQRQILLLCASYLFYYSVQPVYLPLLIGASIFNWGCGWCLGKMRDRPSLLWFGIAVNLTPLISFKYVLATFGSRDALSGASLLLVPLGLSFYTFQSISYLIDVYKNPGFSGTVLEVMLYIGFFPTVQSGPVGRGPVLIPQFRNDKRVGYDRISDGIQRILVGLFLKTVLADTLGRGFSSGEGVNFGFDQLGGGWSGIDVWFLAVGYGFQLFFDFAGYSNIAIGSALLVGIQLPENFNEPFLAANPSEFWKRWHMSLSSWINDYVFFPLAMLGRTMRWRYASLLLSMTIFGIWHGNRLTFALWGLYHGCLLLAHRHWLRLRQTGTLPNLKAPSWITTCICTAATFMAISLGWIFFRANNLRQVVMMFQALLDIRTYATLNLRHNYYYLVALVGFVYSAHLLTSRLISTARSSLAGERLVWLLEPAYFAVILFAIIIFGNQGASFVYFQF